MNNENENIPIYVISLERARERRDYINKKMTKPFQYFDAVDGSNINPIDIILKETYLFKDTYLNNGQIGCYLSHIKILQQISSPSIIFEDDVVFKYDLQKILSIIKKINFTNYDIIFMGHCAESKGDIQQEIKQEEKYFNLHTSVYPRCMHAYIITKEGATKILNFLMKSENHINLPIDEVYAQLIYAKVINSLSFHDTLINQPWQESVNTLNFTSYTGSN
jgi:GR25 family glycosyltransferase involved in LPS biosynthesis